jgi:hypothetical protein
MEDVVAVGVAVRAERREIDELPQQHRIWWDYDRQDYRVQKEDMVDASGVVVGFGDFCDLKRQNDRTEKALLFALERLEAIAKETC